MELNYERDSMVISIPYFGRRVTSGSGTTGNPLLRQKLNFWADRGNDQRGLQLGESLGLCSGGGRRRMGSRPPGGQAVFRARRASARE